MPCNPIGIDLNALIFILLIKSLLIPSLIAKEAKTPFYGMVSYNITEFRGNEYSSRRHISDNLNMKDGSYFKFSVTPEKCKYAIKMFNGVIDMVLQREYVDEGNIDLLMNVFDGKIWINTTQSEVEERNNHRILPSEVTITYDTANTKTILGHTCFYFEIAINKKHDLKSVKGYMTDDISCPLSPLYEMQTIDIKGFPLEFREKHKGMIIEYKASDISQKLDQKGIAIDTLGYLKVSLAEYIGRFGSHPRVLN